MRKLRGVLVGTIVLGVMAIGVGSASATTVNPAGPFTSTWKTDNPAGSNLLFAGKMKVWCGETNISGTVNTAGAGSTTNVAYNGCHVVLPYPDGTANTYELPVTITSMTNWNLQVTRPAGGRATMAVSNVDLRVALTQAPQCTVDFGGGWTDPGQNIGAPFELITFEIAPYNYSTTHFTVTKTNHCGGVEMGNVGETIGGYGFVSFPIRVYP